MNKPTAKQAHIEMARAGMMREESEIATEIGQSIIDAADSIRKFCPDCQAIVQFQIDGMEFVAIVRDKPGAPA